jgi:hypothetical protein
VDVGIGDELQDQRILEANDRDQRGGTVLGKAPQILIRVGVGEEEDCVDLGRQLLRQRPCLLGLASDALELKLQRDAIVIR